MRNSLILGVLTLVSFADVAQARSDAPHPVFSAFSSSRAPKESVVFIDYKTNAYQQRVASRFELRASQYFVISDTSSNPSPSPDTVKAGSTLLIDRTLMNKGI